MTHLWFLPRLRKHTAEPSINNEPLKDIPETQEPNVSNLSTQYAYGNTDRTHLPENDQPLLADQLFVGRGGGEEKERTTSPQPKRTGKHGAKQGGRGPGIMRNARERFYDVKGPTLASITGQLHGAGGYAAETNAPIGMAGRVLPERQADGTYRAEIRWQIIGASTLLPRWADYSNACAAAQGEWDRFMTQTRTHEQAAHVDAAHAFVSNLGPEDTVITGASVANLQRKLEAKQRELARRLQAIHDGCTHGVDIDAILHPENGQCDG